MCRENYDQKLEKSRSAFRQELMTIQPETEYYAITVLADDEGRMQWFTQTMWVGFVEKHPGREIRQASIVKPEAMTKFWGSSGESYVVVNSEEGLLIFFRLGGNALVKKEIAERHLGFIIAPAESAFDGVLGFKSMDIVPNYAQHKVPRPKHRMQIIKRDHYRCKICGRRPENYTDIELHVHHIRPWARGGLTEDDNLITLCDTCHDGLNPHEDLELFSILEPDKTIFDSNRRRQRYYEGMRKYRDSMRAIFEE